MGKEEVVRVVSERAYAVGELFLSTVLSRIFG